MAEKQLQRQERERMVIEGEDVGDYFDEDEDSELKMHERRRILDAEEEDEEIDERRFLDP